MSECPMRVVEIDVLLRQTNDRINQREFRIRGEAVAGVLRAQLPPSAHVYDIAEIAITLRALGFAAVVFDPPPVASARAGSDGTDIAPTHPAS